MQRAHIGTQDEKLETIAQVTNMCKSQLVDAAKMWLGAEVVEHTFSETAMQVAALVASVSVTLHATTRPSSSVWKGEAVPSEAQPATYDVRR